MNKWHPLGPSAESGTCAESGIRNSSPDSGVWKSSSQINGLLQNPESGIISPLNDFGFWNSHIKINGLEQNPESGISSLTGRCHPLKLGVAPNPEPIWWDDG